MGFLEETIAGIAPGKISTLQSDPTLQISRQVPSTSQISVPEFHGVIGRTGSEGLSVRAERDGHDRGLMAAKLARSLPDLTSQSLTVRRPTPKRA